MPNTKGSITTQLESIETELEAGIEKLESIRGCRVFPLLGIDIDHISVEGVFEELIEYYTDIDGKLHVLIESFGGDANAAYNLATLFRRYAPTELVFIVPRWAKSAATLLVCAGDRVDMTPIAELGPVDPQITTFDPLENRFEQFSPLAITATLELIRNEYTSGSKDLAEGLLRRLQFPLTIGMYVKAQEIGEGYARQLLSSRMLLGHENCEAKADELASQLGKGFTDHGYCLKVEEAGRLGRLVKELEGDELRLVWSLYKLYKQKLDLKKQVRASDVIDDLPDDIRETLDDILSGSDSQSDVGAQENQKREGDG